MRASFIFRIRIIAGVLVLIALLIIVRLYLLQVVHGAEYRDKAEGQQIAPSAHQLARGSIFFTSRDGSFISAATIKSGFTLAVLPKLIKDPQESLAAVQKLVPTIDPADFLAKANKKNDPYEELGQHYSQDIGMSVLSAKIPGVQAYRDQWRYYPGNTLAAHEIGFMGFGDGNAPTGQYGLERTYDSELEKPASGTNINFFADLFTNVGAKLFSSDSGPGADLVTSIEPTVQAYLEDELAAYNKEWHAKTVGGIVIDPQTGAIVAMAALPTFDPNNIKGANPNSLSNPLTQNVYEFGSTMKPITMASAIDAGAITPATTYNDTGCLTLDKKTICNFDLKARGVVPMQQILSQSLNVGIAWVVQKMGTATFRDYMNKFGVTEETGIDLPSEASPLVSNLQSPRTVEYVTAGFGQGVAITPVAMARALATLANHGQVPQPHIGTELVYPGGITKQLGWAPPRRAISAASADAVTRMLVSVVDISLANGKAKIPEMSIAAKTGTAQIADPSAGGYYKDRYLHSFFGYFPAYNPTFLVFFFAVEPVGAQYASETWTGPFMDVTKFLTTYYAIPPDRATTTASHI